MAGDAVEEEIRRRAQAKPARTLGIAALIAALGGPAVITPIVMRALDLIEAAQKRSAERAAVQAQEQTRLREDVAACRTAAGRAEDMARDAKSQAAAANARVDSLAPRGR